MMTRLRNIILLFLVFFIRTTNTCAQKNENPLPFKVADYPGEKYNLNFQVSLFSKLKIEIIQVKLKNDAKVKEPAGFYCRGWVNITEGNKTIKQFYFKNIDAVGGCSGLFVPAVQPRSDYFIVSKFGDYDGSIIIIDTAGKAIQKKGSVFYISKDKQYLFSSYDSDMPGLTVYDLNKKKILFSAEIEPNIGDWYCQDNKYFSIVTDDNSNAAKIKIVRFDFSKNNIIITTTDKNYPKKENKLSIFNDAAHAKRCNCGW
ncbi:MAG: hypothetical protein ABI402_14030 [Ferruginibacter sp.]